MPPQLLLEMSPPGVLLFTMGAPPPCMPCNAQVSSERLTGRRPQAAVHNGCASALHAPQGPGQP